MKNRLLMMAFLFSGLIYYGCDFAGWLFPSQPPCTDTFGLRIVILPDGAGSSSVTPDTAFYEYGAPVNISINPNTNYQFSHWEGDASGSSATISLDMTGPKSLIAVFKAATGFCGIAGTVMDSAGGAPVSGTTIAIGSTDLTTTTDATGTFNLISDTLTPGTYDILATKSGMAGSKVQAVVIKSNEVTKVDMIQTNYSFDNSATVPPTINAPNITSSSISVNVTAGSCSVVASGEHESIYLKIGSLSGQLYDAVSKTNTLNFSWDSSRFPPGTLNMKIIAYDINNNRCELNTPFLNTSGSGSAPDIKPGPNNYYINAYSLGKSLIMYSVQQPTNSNSTGIVPYKPTLLSQTISPTYAFALHGAPAGCTAYVNIYLIKVNGTDMYFYPISLMTKGLVVYRALSQAGPYTLAGKTNKYYHDDQIDEDLFQFQDYSSLISPGKTLWYKIAWFNESGEGPASDPIEVPILPVYSLNLQSPSNNSVITDNTPLLQWNPTPVENATRYDELVLMDALTGDIVADQVYTGVTQVESPALSYGVLYKWNIFSCYRLFKGQCLSLSLPSDSYSANNGYYYFSVNP